MSEYESMLMTVELRRSRRHLVELRRDKPVVTALTASLHQSPAH